MATASVIIIGDEILSGRFQDENSPYLLRRLNELGVRALTVSVLPDDMPVIIEELRRRRTDWIFTSGGIGPTHDDVTYEAVARALGVPICRSLQLEGILRGRLQGKDLDAACHMAGIPEGAQLWWGGTIAWPVVVARNIVMLPGVPALFRLKFESVANRFSGDRFAVAEIRTTRKETAIADTLAEAVRRFPTVHIGSYPRFAVDAAPGLPDGVLHSAEVLVVIEGLAAELVEACRRFIEDEIADGP